MALFDDVIDATPPLRSNFKGYVGNPPTDEKEYIELDCWKDSSLRPSWSEMSEKMRLLGIQMQRSLKYPPLSDLADALYWQAQGDNTKLEKYMDACKKVKEDFPK